MAVASEGEEADDNAKVIARALTSAAALLGQSQLTAEEMVEVSCYIYLPLRHTVKDCVQTCVS